MAASAGLRLVGKRPNKGSKGLLQPSHDHGRTMGDRWQVRLGMDPFTRSFFMDHQTAPAGLTTFTALASPNWITVSLAYIKELDTLSAKRLQLTQKGKAVTCSAQNSQAAPKSEGQLSRKQQRAKAWANRKSREAESRSALNSSKPKQMAAYSFEAFEKKLLFWSWAPSLRRLVQATRTPFAHFLSGTFRIRQEMRPTSSLLPPFHCLFRTLVCLTQAPPLGASGLLGHFQLCRTSSSFQLPALEWKVSPPQSSQEAAQ